MGMYNMTSDLLVEPKGQSYMPVGIHENVELTDIVVEDSKNGNPFICFYFTNEKGERVTKTEWPVIAKTSLEEMSDVEKQAHMSKVNNQMSRMCLIAGQFVDKSELIFNANSFKDFILRIKTIIGTRYTGVKLRLKVVYDYNDWATLPSYVKIPWIERMDKVTKEKSRITIVAGTDKIEKSSPDARPENKNPLFEADQMPETPTAPSERSGDLPF